MSRDNWERLVAAVIKREQIWQLCHDHSRSPSVSTLSSDFSEENFNNSLTHNSASPLTKPSVFQGKEDGSKLKTYSPSQFWAWDAFWNRIKPFKKKEVGLISVISEISEGIKLSKFHLDMIAKATNQFSSSSMIEVGEYGFGYKALLPDGRIVAVKRFSLSTLALQDFYNEISFASSLHHRNISELLGYCIHEGREYLLVYDHMAHSTLSDHLYNSENSPLTWKQRLQICIGATKGLHYLHTSSNHPVIHRNVTSHTILLDEKSVPRMYGLSMSRLVLVDEGHVTSLLRGTVGYMDPEYLQTSQLTAKSDVYSFGVVLFEVLSARKPIVSSPPEVYLPNWAKFCFKEGTLEQIIDSNLNGQIAPKCLSEFVRIAFACVENRGADRPAMGEIVSSLEYAMQLQEEAESRGGSMADGDGDSSFIAVRN